MKSVLRYFITIISCVFIHLGMNAQDDYESFKKKMDSSFDEFKKSKNNEYDEFRKRINEEYASLLEKSWKAYDVITKIDVPEDKVKPVPPVVYPKKDNNKPLNNPKPIPYDDVVPCPSPKPQPQPVVPIEEKSHPVVTPPVRNFSFTFWGTSEEVRFDNLMRIKLNSTDETNISRGWKIMSTDQYSNLVYDCLQIRKQRNLSDWGYIGMLKCLSEQIYGKGANEATMLMAYIYCQSGYKMRFARDKSGKLYMLYASDHLIYNINYYEIDGTMFYPYGDSPNQLYISTISFQKETPMSLLVSKEQKLSIRRSPSKIRQSKRYPEVKTSMSSNLNLMEFYNTYPASMIGSNIVSRWALYANSPMNEDVKKQIYPSLRKSIKGCNQLLAINKLLNYVQTGFVYEYDNKVWGHDRAFFAEESLYYPYCDCEDRSILFTRLVRDLLGLNCILVYYPGHLASAVEFTEGNVNGDYIILNGKKYIIADATYINAPVGMTMPDMDNTKAKVILLGK